MNFITRFFSFIIICILFSSCKNEVKSTVENVDNGSTEAVINPIPEMKEIKVVIEGEMNSVMVKSMITPELKTFSSMLVTTGLVEMLSKKEG
ncbi:MAG: hypothetical protein ACI849_001752, partial [Patiriisocius sp.]